MLIYLYLLSIALSVFIFSFLGCHIVRQILELTQTLDMPNERSNHQTPVPRGGGIAVIFAIISFMLITGAQSPLLWAAIGLAIISFIDDREGVPIKQRLLVQIAAVALSLMELEGLVFQGIIPFWADRFLAGCLLVGFLNLTNFMDGIDGITGAHVISIGLGFIAVAFASTQFGIGLMTDGIILIAACAGFLMLNWHPAKLFMGDVGSIPLGLITGLILLSIAAAGHPVAAIILPAYYLVDGGLTFLSRLLKGEKVWEAHSQHGYQKAVRNGWPHDEVVRWMSAFNLILIALATLSIVLPSFAIPALAIALSEAYILRALFCHKKSNRLRRKSAVILKRTVQNKNAKKAPTVIEETHVQEAPISS